MLGAFAAATELVSLETLNKGIEQRFEGNQKLIDLNKKAIKTAEEIKKIDSKAAKWIANDAIHELSSDKIKQRLEKKKN